MARAIYKVNVKDNLIFNVDFIVMIVEPLTFAPSGAPDRLCANSEKLRYLRQLPQFIVVHSSHFDLLRS
jgi:hypothetical protein